MGAGKSRYVPISYEEACRRVDKDVLARIEDTFKRLSTNAGHLPQATFLRDVMGDGMPAKLAEELYHAFGGSQKGISLKDLLCGLTLLTKGSDDEKAKFLSQLLSADGSSITKDAVDEMVSACDIGPTAVNMETLFLQEPFCTVDHFERWVKDHRHLSSFTRWLLVPGESGFHLEGEPDPPTFYQTLGEKYGVTDRDVMDLEKTFWGLRSGAKFEVELFKSYASPPVPGELCEALFDAFDENSDGQLDLAEIVRAVGWVCRRSDKERQKLCFASFDADKDGLLSREELTRAVTLLQRLQQENSEEETSEDVEDVASMVETAMEKFGTSQEGYLTEEEYIQWAESATPLSLVLLDVLFQVCHMRFGLRPRSKADEANIVDGYLLRFHKTGRKQGDTVYIIAGQWFKQWKELTGYEGNSSKQTLDDASSSKKKKKKHRRKNHGQHSQAPPYPVQAPAGATNAATPYSHQTEAAEKGRDAVELLTVAGRQMTSSNSTSSTADGCTGQAGQPQPAVGQDERWLPPIDNSLLLVSDPSNKKFTSLTNEGGFIVKDDLLVEGDHFFFLPDVVWKAFTSWYGTAGHYGGPALPRIVKEDGQIDYYPIQFKVYRHTTLPPPIKPSSLPWPIASLVSTLGLTSPKQPQATPLITGGMGSTSQESGPLQPPIPRRVLYYIAAFISTTTIGEISEYIEKVLHVKSEDLRLYDFTDEENPVLLDDETKTLQDLQMDDGQKLLVETRNKDNSWPEEIIAVMKEVRAKDKETKEKEKEKDKHQSDVHVPNGATGLSNLGNTCFMNSALQCVSNTQPLTTYFRERDYLLEINKDNPLGMGGVMAKRYGELVQDLWTGHSKSITPLKFRFTVGRCAPRFNGFQQQDAQELLAFVLDGLHEDLNRVKEKPYKELKDSDGRPEEEVAKEAWEYHLSRNQSIIVDLFQGQLKSVVRCKVCNYRSMRFDPFTFLSLPLPMESTVDLEIVVVRLGGSQPVRYGLKLEVDEKYRALRQSLSQLCGVAKSNLLLVEMYGSMIRNYPSDSTKIRAQLSGWLYAFEIPDPPSPPTIPTITLDPTPPPITENHTHAELERDGGDKDAGEGEAEGGEGEGGGEGGSEGGREGGSEGGEGEENKTDKGERGDEDLEEENSFTEEANLESRESSSDDAIMTQGRRVVVDRPLGSRDPTPPILLAPEDDDRLVGDAATGFRAVGVDSEEGSHEPTRVTADKGLVDTPSPPLSQSLGLQDSGFIFAVHRKTFIMEHYFVANQKNRPVLFGTPIVVPCTLATPQSEVYESVWRSVNRLIIPDPPSDSQSDQKTGYPFKLALVGKDGLSCAKCPWHRFCRGCPIECSDAPIGNSSPYIAIDWDLTTLHLKYQTAQERPVEHESMESLKTMDSAPIDLYECFKAFVREDDLGDEECWYCKQCKKHQEAVKSLEIWRLPPILIIHLKRFQFFNGRWVKSQRVVRFPISDLDPLRYTVQNGNEPRQDGTDTVQTGEQVRSEESPSSLEQQQEPAEGAVENDLCNSPEANDGEDAPTSKEAATAVNAEGNSHKDLMEVLHRREGHIYNLFAIACHTGVLGGGHYISFCQNPNGKWYYFNDSSCKETTEERVLQESPYLLFYEMNGLNQYSDLFRARKGGKKQDIGSTEDDRAYEETLRNLSKKCCIQ